VPCWIDTVQHDSEAAADFYGALFGWKLREHDAAGLTAAVRHGPPRRPRGRRSRVCVESADVSATKARDAGAGLVTEPFDVLDAGRMGGEQRRARDTPRGIRGARRFLDAVAWMSPLAPDENRPAHWSVTFAVDDSRATAERTLELGGSVLVEPFDGEVVRIAVLADPQGAVFAVNQFEPEGL
jgi:uncharacterized protein